MTYAYAYPQVSISGNRWNMLQRIKNTVGIEPSYSGDHQDNGAWRTVVSFTRDLTVAEKALLDVLMAGDPTRPPAPLGTQFSIEDLDAELQKFRTTTGINWALYLGESVPNSGRFDRLLIQAPTVLNNSTKNGVRSAFAALIRES